MKIPQQPHLKKCERRDVIITDMCGRLGVWERLWASRLTSEQREVYRSRTG